MIRSLQRPACQTSEYAFDVVCTALKTVYQHTVMYIYVIMKTMCPPSYHRAGFLTTHTRTSCVQMHEFPESHCSDNREGTLFSLSHVYYTYLALVRFEHSVRRWLCCELFMTTNILYIYIYIYIYI